jgi:hypothetical protein
MAPIGHSRRAESMPCVVEVGLQSGGFALNNVENTNVLARAVTFFWTISITAAGIAALTAFVLSTKPPVGLLIIVATIAAVFCVVALVQCLIRGKVQYE